MTFSRNGDIDTEVSFLNVLWFDGYSIGSNDFLFDIIIVFILRVRLANNGIFVRDFLLDIFYINTGFFQHLLILLCGKINNAEIVSNLNRDWNMSQFDILFLWLLWHFLPIWFVIIIKGKFIICQKLVSKYYI